MGWSVAETVSASVGEAFVIITVGITRPAGVSACSGVSLTGRMLAGVQADKNRIVRDKIPAMQVDKEAVRELPIGFI